MGDDGYCYVVPNICGLGHFVDATGECQRCHGPCVNCDSSAEGDCWGECKEFALFQPYTTDDKKGQCFCEPGFGMDKETMECVECEGHCSHCDLFDHTKCGQCEAPYQPEVDDNDNVIEPLECHCPWNNDPCHRPEEPGVCVDGKDEDGEKCECHSSCYACPIGATEPYDCLECGTGRDFEEVYGDVKRCSCKAGFTYNNDMPCSECPDLCGVCRYTEVEDEIVCAQCVDNADFPATGETSSCQCTGNLIRSADKKSCVDMEPGVNCGGENCTACASITECTACANGMVPIGGKCHCADGTYEYIDE